MTSSSEQPPKEQEYIIKESYIVAAENNLFSFREMKMKWAADIRLCPHPAPAPQMHTECYIDGYNDGSRQAREDFAKKIYDMCECVPLKEYAPDYDRGFHQAMRLVRLWCTTPHTEQEQP